MTNPSSSQSSNSPQSPRSASSTQQSLSDLSLSDLMRVVQGINVDGVPEGYGLETAPEIPNFTPTDYLEHRHAITNKSSRVPSYAAQGPNAEIRHTPARSTEATAASDRSIAVSVSRPTSGAVRGGTASRNRQQKPNQTRNHESGKESQHPIVPWR